MNTVTRLPVKIVGSRDAGIKKQQQKQYDPTPIEGDEQRKKMSMKDMAGAEFSDCGNYRYKLWRIWDDSKPKAMCIGLNPSTANAKTNDATIRILISALTKLGYGGFYMMNLFAIISSKPEILLNHPDPMGENESKLKEVAALCEDVIFCWGNFKEAQKRIYEVIPAYPNGKCFGFNKNGTPFHPRALNYIKGGLKSPKLIKYE